MTTLDERQRVQGEARDLLRELCDPKLTPGVSDKLRHRAEGLLRHLASPGEIRDVVEVVTRMLQAERERDEYRAAAMVVKRRLIAGVSLVFAVALAAGILIGEWVSR
jgi:hypothetical protein